MKLFDVFFIILYGAAFFLIMYFIFNIFYKPNPSTVVIYDEVPIYQEPVWPWYGGYNYWPVWFPWSGSYRGGYGRGKRWGPYHGGNKPWGGRGGFGGGMRSGGSFGGGMRGSRGGHRR
jgi:hypothetical protein